MTSGPDQAPEGARQDGTRPRGLSRRAFLGTAAAGTAALGGAALGGAAIASAREPGKAAPARSFFGVRQAGILEPPASAGLLAAFTGVDKDRAGLARTFRALSDEAHVLVDRLPVATLDPGLPPEDNGVLTEVDDAGLTVTASVGASLFDARYGLAARKPRELVTMPFFRNDRLDPARSHGDLLLVIQGKEPDVALHALRRLMRSTRDGLVLHWMLEVFTRPDAKPAVGQTQSRNLLGFKDGTANPDANAANIMDDLVWTSPADGEPAWTAGGSYQVVRAIRMFVEHWDRTSLTEQEEIIGRHKASGAPLGGSKETDPLSFDGDPQGERMPLDAHIRLANPRTPETAHQVLLRRGFSYSRGVDQAGQLDQGLAFLSYQRKLANFVAVQNRLAREPLEEYIRPEGGGFFFALPGATGPGDWLGRTLLT